MPRLYIWRLLHPWDNSEKAPSPSPYHRAKDGNKDIQNTCPSYRASNWQNQDSHSHFLPNFSSSEPADRSQVSHLCVKIVKFAAS